MLIIHCIAEHYSTCFWAVCGWVISFEEGGLVLYPFSTILWWSRGGKFETKWLSIIFSISFHQNEQWTRCSRAQMGSKSAPNWHGRKRVAKMFLCDLITAFCGTDTPRWNAMVFYPTLLRTIPFLQTENKALYPSDKWKNFLDHRRLIANNKNEICRSLTSTKMN